MFEQSGRVTTWKVVEVFELGKDALEGDAVGILQCDLLIDLCIQRFPRKEQDP